MRKLLLILALALSSPWQAQAADVTTGWVERTDCGDIASPQLYVYCKQTTTVSGRTAGVTYYWNGSAWIAQSGGGGGASDFSELTGAATDAQIPNTITIDTATTAGTATALVSNPTDCLVTGAFAHTIAASGNLTCSILLVSSASDPTANDDTGDGYIVGTRWINTTADTIYEAVDVTSTAAIWKPVVTTGTSNEITVTANTVSLAEAIRNLSGRHGVDSGSSDAYVASITTADASYISGAFYSLTPNTVNTGGATVNFNGLGVVFIRKWVSGAKVNLADGDICATQKILLQYDGTDMVLQSPLCNPTSGSLSGTTGTIAKFGSATTGIDSALVEDADSVNSSKAVEICPTTCLFALDTSAFSATIKTWGFPANASDTFVGAASAGTLTNKTLDTEGTGNVITTKSKIWMPAAGGSAASALLLWDTLAANAPTATCAAGTTETTMLRCTADFPDSDGDYSLQQTVSLPSDWTGAIDALIKYRMVGTTGSVVWQVITACRADAEVDDVAFNAASTVTDAAKGTTLQLNDASIAGVTATGCAAGELMHLKVQRNRTHASDDATGVISLVGVELTLRRAQ